MRQIFFLAQAEVLHIVRDRILLAQTLIVPMERSANGEKGSSASIVQSSATRVLINYAKSESAGPVPSDTASRPAQIEIRTGSRYNATNSYACYAVRGILVALMTR